MVEMEKTEDPGRENEAEEVGFDFEGVRETLLVQLAPPEAAAMRELGRMLEHYARDPREEREMPWARLPYLEFVGVARELRYLERYLLEIAGMLFEIDEPEDERSSQLQEFARSRGGELGRLAGEVEAKIEELEKQGFGSDSEEE
jgi:hypothetical protein